MVATVFFERSQPAIRADCEIVLGCPERKTYSVRLLTNSIMPLFTALKTHYFSTNTHRLTRTKTRPPNSLPAIRLGTPLKWFILPNSDLIEAFFVHYQLLRWTNLLYLLLLIHQVAILLHTRQSKWIPPFNCTREVIVNAVFTENMAAYEWVKVFFVVNLIADFAFYSILRFFVNKWDSLVNSYLIVLVRRQRIFNK